MNFEEQVNEVVSKATVDEKGNLQLPEGEEYSPEVLYAAKLEKRHRDTQSSYTKNQQRIKHLEKENTILAQKWEKDAIDNLTSAEKADLEELKVQDPDAYITKVTEIKEAARTKFNEQRNQVTSEITQMTELERREMLLDEYNTKNPEYQITDDTLQNDLPPRLVKQFEKAEISFEEFLDKASTFLKTPKKIKDSPKGSDDPDLSKLGGSDSPTDSALNKQNSDDYSKTVF